MSLLDRIELARQLHHKVLSSNTRPTEKEARAAADKVLRIIGDILFNLDLFLTARDENRKLFGDCLLPRRGVNWDERLSLLGNLGGYLLELSYVINPSPADFRAAYDGGYLDPFAVTRRANFSDLTQGAAKIRKALAKRLAIAHRVHELRKAGKKAPIQTTADEFGVDRTEVSRILGISGIKGYLETLDRSVWSTGVGGDTRPGLSRHRDE